MKAKRTNPGARYYLKHKNGERLSSRQRIIAHCYTCMAKYADGKVDCGINDCMLYPIMPYRVKTKAPESILSPQ